MISHASNCLPLKSFFDFRFSFFGNGIENHTVLLQQIEASFHHPNLKAGLTTKGCDKPPSTVLPSCLRLIAKVIGQQILSRHFCDIVVPQTESICSCMAVLISGRFNL